MARNRRSSTGPANNEHSSTGANLRLNYDELKLLLAQLQSGELTGLEEPKDVHMTSEIKHLHTKAAYRGFYRKIREPYLKSKRMNISYCTSAQLFSIVKNSESSFLKPTIRTASEIYSTSAPGAMDPVLRDYPHHRVHHLHREPSSSAILQAVRGFRIPDHCDIPTSAADFHCFERRKQHHHQQCAVRRLERVRCNCSAVFATIPHHLQVDRQQEAAGNENGCKMQ